MVRHAHAHKHLRQKPKRDGFDWLLYVFMIATPLFEIPQLLEIYQTQSAQNVSLPTWAFFALSNIAWIAYAIRHKLSVLIVVYSLYLVIEVSIVIGIFLYR